MNHASPPSMNTDSEETKVSTDKDEGYLDLEASNAKEKSRMEFDSGFSCVSLENSSTSFAETKDVQHINSQDEKKLVRTLDIRIMPLFCLFYFADFLDRANIGNATLAGLQTDLEMTAYELSTAISAFFITYVRR
ncbi:uncharacterized protein ATC70_000733 [Mucor velutinosus]|uniref:Uncharacterized protein n=1 Tax=Mucor velutinosus TaxID=708070 RepID=A0AAN7DHY9_9FUNG|nr:hypothetical protein ATC70_000733 [Mucor velutinosus]